MDKKNKYFGIGLILIVLIIGFIFGKLYSARTTSAKHSQPSKAEYQTNINKQWSFINPLLDCGELENISNKTINEMKQKIIGFIDEQKTQGVSSVSVYFRDLNNGPWLGLDEKEEFFPGSLLKVPMMMRVLKDAENNPSLLNRAIFIKELTNPTLQYYKPDIGLAAGKTYTVAELVSLMIMYSDNGALEALEQVIGSDRLYQSYEELGITKPVEGDYHISARSYASFFRILFNASYLNDDFSEQALKLLAASTFSEGLRSGVSSSTVVAHKFGERTDGNKKQLHDCGIVYYPNQPYLLCVMTRGNDFDQLAGTIAGISDIIYKQIAEGGKIGG